MRFEVAIFRLSNELRMRWTKDWSGDQKKGKEDNNVHIPQEIEHIFEGGEYDIGLFVNNPAMDSSFDGNLHQLISLPAVIQNKLLSTKHPSAAPYQKLVDTLLTNYPIVNKAEPPAEAVERHHWNIRVFMFYDDLPPEHPFYVTKKRNGEHFRKTQKAVHGVHHASYWRDAGWLHE